MAVNRGISSIKSGMNRDSHPADIKKEEYSFALNANIQDEHGSGSINIQNEPSNVKCTGFKSGYKVIGHKHDPKKQEVYFFLTNPTTGVSEIGRISGLGSTQGLTPAETTNGSNLQVVLETPLEQTTQISTCSYETLLDDSCNKCLNFSIDAPIHENNIHIKYGKAGRTLWWTDGYRNPQRYIQLDDLGIYTNTVNNCTDEETERCLNCEKMRVFPLFDIPCLTPEVIQNGGNIPAGMVEAIICYSNSRGDALTSYYSLTNPIPIQDPNNNILDQTNLNYRTNQAIKFSVSGLDESYGYYKAVAVYRSGLDGAVSIFEVGVFPIHQTTFTIVDFENKTTIELSEILSRRPYYSRAKNLAVANGYIYHTGLIGPRDINLQPVANLLGSFAKWNTYQAKEDLYVDGIGVSNYRSAMRDEVYPYGIVFELTGGQETTLFPFIARPPFDTEVEEVDVESDDVESILSYNKQCQGNDRTKVWQFYNTAQVLGDCLVPEGEGIVGTEVEREVESTCFVRNEDGELIVVDDIESSTFDVPSDVGIVDYINSNIDAIINSIGPNGEDIRDILSSASEYPESCEPSFGTNCSEEIELVSETVFAIDVESEAFSVVFQDLDQYIPTVPNNECQIWEYDTDGIKRDTDFETAYMNAGEVVYSRINSINNSCANAVSPNQYVLPQVPNSQHHLPKGEVSTLTTLQDTSKTVTTTMFAGEITLTGTTGTANINIGGVDYLATFSGNLTTTASNFVTTHAASILSATGLVVTSIVDIIILTGSYTTFHTTLVVNVSGDLVGDFDNKIFLPRLHSNALWYKVNFSGSQKVIFDIGPTTCTNSDDNSEQTIRVTAFLDCGSSVDIPTYGRVISNTNTFTTSNFVELDSSDFAGVNGIAYIAIDTPIRAREVSGKGQVNTLLTTCGCFPVYRRFAEFVNRITYTNLTFGKRQTYKTMCTFVLPQLNNCDAVPYKKGLFSYVESTERYPCSKELYDSSTLRIDVSDIPVDYRTEFETYYVDSTINGQYILKPDTDFRDKPIRHFKFPDNVVAPFMSYETPNEPSQNPGPFGKSIIYPIGFSINPTIINAFLDVAVKNNLITIEERSRINGYKIFRGDRRTERSIVAKGLLFDTYKYKDSYTDPNSEEILYSNFPLNSLGQDQYNEMFHPFLDQSNNAYTFHSPETSFYKPSLTSEIKIEGYLYGASANYFDEVRNHPTYVLLGSTAYATATALAIAESLFEFLIQSTDWLISGAAGALGSGGASVGIAVAGVAATTLQIFLKTGDYRYRWLKTFTDLGKPTNFAYYQASIGHYNLFKPNLLQDQLIRGLRSRTYLREGRWEIADEIIGSTYNFNNLDGEDSVFMHLGDYPLNYPTDYIAYDNVNLNPSLASRRKYSGTGKSSKITGRAASPYATIKEYLPGQYGQIDDISWLDTGFCGSLLGFSDCDAAFGGDVIISRFSLKRKTPFFRTNAFGLAPLTPFKYSDYYNINPSQSNYQRNFIDYEINEDEDFIGTVLYPSNRSKFRLDSGGTNIGGFYVKLPNKFYLFSYGIPYFLVESEINCNYRYAQREPHENFYPNINDVIEFTQEENVSIRRKNEYFYNSIYSSTKSLYPYDRLPQDYQRKLYDKLVDMSNAVIYSEQDTSENFAYDPWLQYKAANYYEFSKVNGNLVTISGIESQQLLARFTDGFTIFGAIDQLADRLTPETGNLGTGGIFAGRPIDFNITELGYAGTQHNVKVSNEFGHFWVDAVRGKVFHLAPNGKELKEISKPLEGINTGLEKWFKENLPLKLPTQVSGLSPDNALNRVGITMGWDDRLKRVFVTKKDYTPLQPINYLDGIGFYTGNINCPEGFELINNTCVRVEDVPKIQSGTPVETFKTGSASHGMQPPVLYSAYEPDGSGLVDVGSPTGFTFERLTEPFWLGGGDVALRITSLLGRWVSPQTLNVWYGGTALVNVPTTKTYYIILAADNKFRFKVDDVLVIESGVAQIGIQHTANPANYTSQVFRQVHIYPIELEEGCHLITIEGLNEGSEGMFAGAILDNTDTEIRDATSYDDLNFLYSTADTENFFLDDISFNCPDGYVEIGSDFCDECRRIITQNPTAQVVQLDNTQYFRECSWTVAYSPIIGNWISYYSFKPNYYIAYSEYFQTGINNGPQEEFGLWSHYSFQSSYQVFYGKLYPFIIEYPLTTSGTNSELHHIEYWLDVRKYYNKYDVADAYGVGFNKAIVYNSFQNTGLLELVHQKEEDLYQHLDYPLHKVNSVEILQTEINHKWSFNFLHNRIRNERSGLPIWLSDCAQIEKTLDDRLLDYSYQYLDYMRGDHFLVRLINDKESRFKFIFRFATDQRKFYEQ